MWICSISVHRFPIYPPKNPFLSVVTLTFDLDLQTHPSEGPNTSRLWIWRKSVQRFRRYFIHKQKCRRQRQKQNFTQFVIAHFVQLGHECTDLTECETKTKIYHATARHDTSMSWWLEQTDKHTTRVYGPCLRAANTGSVYRALGRISNSSILRSILIPNRNLVPVLEIPCFSVRVRIHKTLLRTVLYFEYFVVKYSLNYIFDWMRDKNTLAFLHIGSLGRLCTSWLNTFSFLREFSGIHGTGVNSYQLPILLV